MRFRAAIFDLDGTLLDSMSIWSNLCREFLLRHDIDDDIDLDGKLGVISMRNALEYLMLSELARRLDILTSPFSRDVIPAAEAEKIVFRDELSIWCSGGMSYTLSMAKLENGDAAAKLHTELVPGRLPRAAGESDHDYELRQKQQAVNAEYEKKAYNGRVFRIKADLMDLLASVPAESETGK